MKIDRSSLLKIVAIGMVALLVLDHLVFSPLLQRWKESSERIDQLRSTVARGRQLLEREDGIRRNWAQMLEKDLPADHSLGENNVMKAIARWVRESRVTCSALTPQWQTPEKEFQLLEMRVSLTGDQGALFRFLYELEIDPLPVRLKTCEFSTRDDKGRQLMLNVTFTALALGPTERSKP